MGQGTVRVGIIGCGQIGRTHIKRYLKMTGVEIVAVADIKRAARDAAAAQAGGVRAFKDFRDLLALAEIDAVDVCLHNNLHAPVTIEALKAGTHVYCEKPIAGTYADGLAMVKAAAKHDRKLQIQLGSLFSAETKVAKRLMADGVLGAPYYAKSVGFRRRGRCFVDGYGSAQFVQKKVAAGGALFDMGVYHISQMLYLLGNPAPRTITGSTYQRIDMYEDRKRASRFNVEELGLGFVRLTGDVTLAIEESWAVHLGSLGRSHLVGPRGGLTFGPLTLHTTEADVELNADVQVDAADRRWRSVDPDYAAFDSPQRHWIATLNGSIANPIDTAAIALNTMLISEGVYLSQRLGREVTAVEVRKMSKSTGADV